MDSQRAKAQNMIEEFGETMSVEELLQLAQSSPIETVTTENVLAAVLQDPERQAATASVLSVLNLKRSDIYQIPNTLARNPYYRSAAPMRLYPLLPCIRRSVEIHGSIHQLRLDIQEKELKKAERKRKREDKARTLREQRIRELQAAFEPRNLEIRSDSRLCNEYLLRKQGNESVARKIARIMDEMRFYKNKTRYDDFFESVRDQWIEHKGRYDPDEVSDDAKDQALKDWVRTNNDRLESLLNEDEFPPSLKDQVHKINRSICYYDDALLIV